MNLIAAIIKIKIKTIKVYFLDIWNLVNILMVNVYLVVLSSSKIDTVLDMC